MTIDSIYSVENRRVVNERYRFLMESVGADAIVVWLRVTFAAPNEGVISYLVPPEAYSLVFGREAPIWNGGEILFNVAPIPTTSNVEFIEVRVDRYTPRTQETTYTDGKPFPAEQFEFGLDKLTMIFQELDDGKCDCRNPNDPEEPPPPPPVDPVDPPEECNPPACDAMDDWEGTDYVDVTQTASTNPVVPAMFGDWEVTGGGGGNPWGSSVWAQAQARLGDPDLNPMWCDVAGAAEPLVLASRWVFGTHNLQQVGLNRGGFAATIRGTDGSIIKMTNSGVILSGNIEIEMLNTNSINVNLPAGRSVTLSRQDTKTDDDWIFVQFDFRVYTQPEEGTSDFEVLFDYYYEITGFGTGQESGVLDGTIPNALGSVQYDMLLMNSAPDLDIGDIFTGTRQEIIDARILWERRFASYEPPEYCEV
jgi:hypothetical protein